MSDAGKPNASLAAVGLKKTFNSPSGPVEVLHDTNLAISAGESISIRGESGVGKTTLLSLLSGLEKPDAGELYWWGEPVLQRTASWQARQRARRIGFVFQAFYLLPELSVFENVLFPRRLIGRVRSADRKRAGRLLHRVGLEHRQRHMPQQLSGGEAQRVAIARALINEPGLIMADEPTGNLDERMSNEVMQMFLSLCREEQLSLLLVTHDKHFAQRTDRQGTLSYGKLAIADQRLSQ